MVNHAMNSFASQVSSQQHCGWHNKPRPEAAVAFPATEHHLPVANYPFDDEGCAE